MRNLVGVALALAVFSVATRAGPQTQELKGEVVSPSGVRLAEALCTLKGFGLPAEGIAVSTNERGEFDFPGLAAGKYDLTCVAVDHLPISQKDLEITPATPLVVQVVLPDAKVRQTVEVRGTAPTAALQTSTLPSHLASPALVTLPLLQQEFKAALPVVPGVMRSPDGKINIKGSVESQGMLLADSVEMVDPITGSYSIDLPLDAIESLEVFKTPYNAEFGHFSGGLTSLLTKPPSDRWEFQLYDLVPGFRGKSGHIVGVSDNSPRIRFTGPLSSRLSMSESFIYFMHRQPVRGLPWPHNETNQQGVTSFTNFQYVYSPTHLATFSLHIFPSRQQFADINSLVPQSASTDYGQRGFSVGMLDHLVFKSGGVLSSALKYTRFSSYAHGQGLADMLVTPNGWEGNFFNGYTRTSDQGEFRETYQFPHLQWKGGHALKVGGDAEFRTYYGVSQSHPINVLRADNSLAERISFSAPGTLGAHDTEVGLFAQDHWALTSRFTLDAGLRFSGQTIGNSAVLSPRLGFVYAPGKEARTIFRGGIGVFYDRMPLLAGSFTENPTRIITLFDTQGNLLGPPVTYQNAYAYYKRGNYQILPRGRDLNSTPYSLTWSGEVDREITSRVTLRLSYLSSPTHDLFLVAPQQLSGMNPMLLMTNIGGSRYDEFESTVRFRISKLVDFNSSYVHSRARGDLSTLAQEYVRFEQPIIRPNLFANLNSNIPDRWVTWGRFNLPWKITASPVLDLHTGFPYSAVDALQNYVGQPNSLRLPTFMSLDLKLSKDFRIPFLPWVKKHTLRGAIAVYNLTDSLNPRDVYNNVTSPYFRHFAGPQHTFFEPFLDFVY